MSMIIWNLNRFKQILSGRFLNKFVVKWILKIFPSVLWRCWLADRKGIRPVKTEWWGAGVVICLDRHADLHMAQLMPLLLTVSSFRKIQIGFTFLVPAHLGSPRKKAVKRVCVDTKKHTKPHLAYVATLPCGILNVSKTCINDKLRGSVATYLRYGRVVNNHTEKGLRVEFFLNRWIFGSYKQERNSLDASTHDPSNTNSYHELHSCLWMTSYYVMVTSYHICNASFCISWINK